MTVGTDTEVAVLSARSDLDLAISTWLPGYVAQCTDDLDTVVDVARRGGIVLVDLGSPCHEEWVAALHDRGFDGPLVFLDPRGDVTIDLRERVVVPSPPSLSGLLAGFEEAQVTGRRRRRGDSAGVDERTPTRGRRRTSTRPATTGTTSRPAQPRPTLEGDGVTGRARRLDRRQDPAAAAVPRQRRSDRRNATWAMSLWGSLRRRSSAAAASSSGEVYPGGTGARSQSDAEVDPRPTAAPARFDPEVDPRPTAAPARFGAEAERAFLEVFRDAETQPGFQRRVATAEGRVRVQTDEELFADHPASTPAAVGVGTVPTPVPPRERRARVGV